VSFPNIVGVTSPNKRGRGLNPDALEGKTVSVSYRTADVLLDVHSGNRVVLMIVESQSLHKREKIHKTKDRARRTPLKTGGELRCCSSAMNIACFSENYIESTGIRL
jgi:hypothetical protein